jgi:trans-aconitate 2-methyltransferase
MDSREPYSDKQWDACLYDRKHSFVWKYGEGLIELLAPQPGERILDLGCGTAHLTSRIAESGAEVVGVDLSPEMIEQARGNYPGLRFEVADGTSLRFDSEFDAVFSNAAIHWMKDPAGVAASIYRALKPGGRFVAEFGHKGNLKSIHSAILAAARNVGCDIKPAFKYYPTIGEYATLLEQAGFRVAYAAYYERPTPLEGGEQGLRNWMEMFTSNMLNAVPPEKRAGVTSAVEEQLRPRLYRAGGWSADYKRIRVKALKEQ